MNMENRNNRYSVGGTILSGMIGAYIGYKIGRSKPQKKGFSTEKRIGRNIKGALSKKKMAKGGSVDEDIYFAVVIKKDDKNYNKIGYSKSSEFLEDKQGNKFDKLYFGNKKTATKYNAEDVNYGVIELDEFTSTSGRKFILLKENTEDGRQYYYILHYDDKSVYAETYDMNFIKYELKRLTNGKNFYSKAGVNFGEGGGVSKFPVAIERRINEINELFPKVKEADEIAGGYFGSTHYTYVQLEKPIEIKGKYVYIHSANGKYDMTFEKRYNVNKLGDEFDGRKSLNYDLSNILKAFKSVLKGKFAGGGKAKGIEWMKSDGQYEAELGDLYLIISPSTERGLYQVRVKKGYRGETIGESQNEISGLDKAKDLAYDIAGDYYKQFGDGGGVHTMPDGSVMLNSAHYEGGGRVKYYLNGFEESLNYIMDSTNAKVVSREGSKENGDLIVYFETTDEEYEYAGGGGVSRFKEGDRVTNIKGKNRGVGFIVKIENSGMALIDFVEEGKTEFMSLDDLKKSNQPKMEQGGGISGLDDLIRG